MNPHHPDPPQPTTTHHKICSSGRSICPSCWPGICHQALRGVEELLASGHVDVVDADLKGYFDTIPKDRFEMRRRESLLILPDRSRI